MTRYLNGTTPMSVKLANNSFGKETADRSFAIRAELVMHRVAGKGGRVSLKGPFPVLMGSRAGGREDGSGIEMNFHAGVGAGPDFDGSRVFITIDFTKSVAIMADELERRKSKIEETSRWRRIELRMFEDKMTSANKRTSTVSTGANYRRLCPVSVL
ncbi:hypothetical protein GWI33_005611 [Rhynchophorus ferrugineus]|uniref:Uncharacterized protein n=1 Tax=Rhynchophorus ferrugineus TaxID=354439 RepID=A0A834IK60_RHYFE|nr:hypothetical protein GWI33_005611 [Rhynchophorus ferrugineus]